MEFCKLTTRGDRMSIKKTIPWLTVFCSTVIVNSVVIFSSEIPNLHQNAITQKSNRSVLETKNTASPVPNSVMSFKSIPIGGYIENPNTIIITGIEDNEMMSFSLNRSFKDAIRENTDKETMERAHGF